MPGSLIGFFAIVAVIFAGLGVHAWQVSRPWPEPTAVVDGVAASFHEPGLLDRGAGTVVVRYTVGGAPYTLDIAADTDDRVIKQGDTVPVEYAINRPTHARAVWTVEAGRTDAPFWAGLAGLCAALGVASGVGYLSGAAGAAPDDSATRDRLPTSPHEQRPQRNSAQHRNPTRGPSHRCCTPRCPT